MSRGSNSGRNLNIEWKVGAKHALYHHIGTWYHVLKRFPGALFDKDGYVLFSTESDFNNRSELHIGKHVSVPKGLSEIRGYIKVRT